MCIALYIVFADPWNVAPLTPAWSLLCSLAMGQATSEVRIGLTVAALATLLLAGKAHGFDEACAKDCTAHGTCSERQGTCLATTDTDCQMAAVCRMYGRCLHHPEQGQCVRNVQVDANAMFHAGWISIVVGGLAGLVVAPILSIPTDDNTVPMAVGLSGLAVGVVGIVMLVSGNSAKSNERRVALRIGPGSAVLTGSY